jgi:hypothetical protein
VENPHHRRDQSFYSFSPIRPSCRKCASVIFMGRSCYEVAPECVLLLTPANAVFPDSGGVCRASTSAANCGAGLALSSARSASG